MVYWIMGQPGSGKTTLGKLLIEDRDLQTQGHWAHVDGDNIRDIFQNKDYSRAGRLKNGDFAIQLCKYLTEQGLNVIVSLVTPYQYTRNRVREEFPDVRMIELYYNHDLNRREEERMVSDYEFPTPTDLILGLDTGRLNEVQCVSLIKANT